MENINLFGAAEPSDSFRLHQRLEAITSTLRPSVTVDLSSVEELHPSIVSVLIRHRRQARRQGGDITLIRPRHAEACRTLDHVGLVGAR